MSNTSELAYTYAALILHDDGIEITAEKIAKLVKAANVNVESYWPSLFAKLFREEQRLIMNVGASGTASASAKRTTTVLIDAAAAADADAAADAETCGNKTNRAMVFGLFD
ncbi:hypothetical protein YC2023_113507 [Brassica napus]